MLGQSDLNSFTSGADAAKINAPNALALDAAGNLWVADQSNNRVLRFPNATTAKNGAAAAAVLGQSDFTSIAPATSRSGMNSPAGLCMDAAGTLWVADLFNNRVLRFDAAAAKPNGADADGVLGQADFITNLPGSVATSMNQPYGVATAPDGTLFVADSINSRVLRFTTAAQKPDGAAADGVLGQPTLEGGFSGTTAQRIASPMNIALDSAGTLAIADRNNHRCLLWTNAVSCADYAAAAIVLGQPDFTSTATSSARDRITDPLSVKFDAVGRLWAVDSSARRVLRFDPSVLRGSAFQPRVFASRVKRTANFRILNSGLLPARFQLTVRTKIRGKDAFRLRWTLDGVDISRRLRTGAVATRLLPLNESSRLLARARRKGAKTGRLRITLMLKAVSANYSALQASGRVKLKL